MQVSDTDDAALAHQSVVEEAAMEPLGWDFSKEQISLHQRSDSWDRYCTHLSKTCDCNL